MTENIYNHVKLLLLEMKASLHPSVSAAARAAHSEIRALHGFNVVHISTETDIITVKTGNLTEDALTVVTANDIPFSNDSKCSAHCAQVLVTGAMIRAWMADVLTELQLAAPRSNASLSRSGTVYTFSLDGVPAPAISVNAAFSEYPAQEAPTIYAVSQTPDNETHVYIQGKKVNQLTGTQQIVRDVIDHVEKQK